MKITKQQDFLVLIHSHFLYGMHGFRDNEVLMKVAHDEIGISSPWGA